MVISNFFENSWRYSLVKVQPRYQRYRQQILQQGTASVFDTAGKFATGANDTGSKFAAGLNDTVGKYWEQYQTADTLK